jgi:predicted alpha/beta superfamily hydrolase
MPQKAATMAGVTDAAKITGMPGPSTGTIDSDAYLAFIVKELKPFIDAHYRTLPGMKNTSIMGSSMGGLISLYAIVEYPQVFGQAACLSTHWPASDGAVIHYVKSRLPDPATHRIYFDYGTRTLDAQYQPYQARMDAAMRARGYVEGSNWITLNFPGAEHSETSWAARVDVPLQFLLAGKLTTADSSVPDHLVP